MTGQTAAATRVRLCGRLAVEIDGRALEATLPGRQGRLLFAYLVLHRQRPVRRDELSAVLWPDRLPASPESALNTLISRLRSVLGEGVVRGRSQLTLDLAGDAWVDVEVALAEVQRAERALERSHWLQAADAAAAALGVAERGLLPELRSPWADEERARIEELHLRALECVAACGLGIGGARLSDTERSARALIAISPYRETGYSYLMQALAERGRVAEALTVFDDARGLLQRELGAPPGPGLRALHERLLSERAVAPQAERDDPLAVGSQTVTLLFSDVVTEVDDERPADLRRAHARLVRHAVAAHGGRGLAELDDGSAAVFTNARSALRCAVAVQQVAERTNRRNAGRHLRVRAALHCGEALDPGDEHASASLAMTRVLCELAEAGQIVASAVACSLAEATHDVRRIAPIGGDDERPALFEVSWQPAPHQPFALPAALAGEERSAFVGRESDLAWLSAIYADAARGSRRIVLLRGDPGIGKTRLAIELALHAHRDGAVVLYGRCDEEPLVPHQPFVEALRQYVTACPFAELAGQVGPGSGELRPLVPELHERIPELPPALTGDPEGGRYRVFEAAVALLREAAQTRPLLLVLDDLHWADKPSLLLLRHLIRSSHGSALMVLGTYRDAEVDAGHPLSETLAELSRDDSLRRRSLEALDAPATAELVRVHTGREAAGLEQLIFRETDGNPFFVVQMLRHLAESGSADGAADHPARLPPGVPEGVKDVIGRRIARLGERTPRVLAIASVTGRDFELAVLGRMAELDEDALVETLEHALRARVIEAVPGAGGSYTFAHALIRETLYEALTAPRRALLHRRAAAAIEEVHAADLERYRAELAHHLIESGTTGDLDKAIEYGARAAERAITQLAYEQAAAHYRRAVDMLAELDLPARRHQRCDLVIAQGEAERQAGDPAYRETLLEAARLAAQLGDAGRLARAALANNRGFFSAPGGVDRERVGVLEAALAAQGDRDTPTRATLLAQLAVELVAEGNWSRRAGLSDEALAMARRLGDPSTLLRTLNYRYPALMGSATLAERLANCLEANALADRIADPVLAFHAAHCGSNVALECGDLGLSDQMLERESSLATRLGQPIMSWFAALDRAKRCCVSGAPGQADILTREALEIGRRSGQLDAFGWYVNQLVVIRFLQGSLGDGRPNFVKAAEQATPYDGRGQPTGSSSVPLLVEAVHIVTLCEVGRGDEARERFDELMRDELAGLPRNWATLSVATLASVACGHLDDALRAKTLYALLEPDAEHFICTGPCWFGATSHHLAVLAGTMRRYDEADDRFAATVDAYVGLGADAWLVRARLDWARSLLARPGAAQTRRGEHLLRETRQSAERLGLPGIAQRSAALLALT